MLGRATILTALAGLCVLAAACTLVTELDGLAGTAAGGIAADAGQASDAPESGADAAEPPATGVTFVTSGAASATRVSSLTVTLTEAPKERDLLLALVYDGLAESSPPASEATPPAGWSVQLHDGYWWTFYAFAPASPQTSFTFAFSEDGQSKLPYAAVAISVYRGVDPGNPFEDAHHIRCPGNGTSTDTECSAPSITTTHVDAMLVLLCGLDGAEFNPSWTSPSGMVERADVGYAAIADRRLPNAGPTGIVSSTHAVSGWSSHLNLFALVPRR